jgi:hypothetical protein
MGTYWDDFLREYPDAAKLAPVVMLEAFWRYCQGGKERERCMLEKAARQPPAPEDGEIDYEVLRLELLAHGVPSATIGAFEDALLARHAKEDAHE